MKITKGYASVRSGQIHYVETGSGAPLVLFHSTPRTWRAYRKLIPLLAPHRRVFAPDTPGFGASDPLDGPVSMEALAGTMAGFLDAVGVERADIFGFHTGNKIAAAFASEHPNRTGRLVLCGMIHSIIPDMATRNGAIRHIVDKFFPPYPVSPGGEHHLRKWLSDWHDISALAVPRGLYAKNPVTTEDIEELKVRVLDHVQALSLFEATYAANYAFDLQRALTRITAETLVIELAVPEEERYGRQVNAVCDLLTSGRGVTIENAGGGAPDTHAEEIASAVLEFLSAPAQA